MESSRCQEDNEWRVEGKQKVWQWVESEGELWGASVQMSLLCVIFPFLQVQGMAVCSEEGFGFMPPTFIPWLCGPSPATCAAWQGCESWHQSLFTQDLSGQKLVPILLQTTFLIKPDHLDVYTGICSWDFFISGASPWNGDKTTCLTWSHFQVEKELGDKKALEKNILITRMHYCMS